MNVDEVNELAQKVFENPDIAAELGIELRIPRHHRPFSELKMAIYDSVAAKFFSDHEYDIAKSVTGEVRIVDLGLKYNDPMEDRTCESLEYGCSAHIVNRV